MLVHSSIEDNQYGAATVLLKKYPIELLDKCLGLFNDDADVKRYQKVFWILKLEMPYNRGPLTDFSDEQSGKRYHQWKELSELVRQME